MSYRIVERRPDQHETTTEVGGRSYPVPSIVEDDDGLRLLLTTAFWVPVDLWVWAHQNGACALVNVAAMKYALSSTFSDERTENPRAKALVLAEEWWQPYTPGMSFLDMTGDRAVTAAEHGAWISHESREEVGLAQNGLSEDDLPDLGEFVHLHAHSEFSGLDGVTTVEEMVKIISADGQKALAITDHGYVTGHPALQIAAEKLGIQPIFGLEANFVSDRTVQTAETKGDYQHLVIWAMDQQGLRNLWALATASCTEDAFYYRPRIDWELLERFQEGLMVSTACLRGPVLRPYLDGDEATARANLARLHEIFGDRLYVELHVNQLPEQIRANEWLVPLAQSLDLSMIAVVDSHYGQSCDSKAHRVWLSVQTDSDVADDGGMFGGEQEYHLMTAAEVRAKLAYLGEHVVEEAMRNTVRVARRCTARIEPKVGRPIFSRPNQEWSDPVAHDVDLLWALIDENWESRVPKDADQEIYLARVEREMAMIIKKGYCGYFLVEAEMVVWAKDRGILVGPSRGSGGGSLVAFIIRITEMNPIQRGLMFERFMTEGRDSPPDFDVDYPASTKTIMFDHLRERWGPDNVAIVGTHVRLASKGIINDIARAMKSTLPENYFMDLREVARIIDEAEAGTAGLGMDWEDLWVQHGDQLQPYRDRYPQVFEMADALHGRFKTFGTHPAGVIISDQGAITDELPLRRGGEGAPMVCQFDMVTLDALNYTKYDLLSLRTLDTLQLCVDLIEQTTGERVDIYGWAHDVEYADPQIFDEFSAGHTLGCFQIETQAGTRLTKRFGPASVSDLADVITLVRPGPMRSGLTEEYFLRRSGASEATVPDPRLEPVLAKTFGCLLYQEDVMQTCMVIAGYDENEADEVRSILGKKKIEKVAAAGQKFLARAVANGTDPLVAKLLWEQQAEFAKYSFNRAHACAYATVAFWTGWFKFHYPVQLLCAALSTVKEARIPEFVEEARRMGYSVQPPDINESAEGFTATAMSVRYGLMAIKGIGEAVTRAVLPGQPYASFEDFLERRGPECNDGKVKILARIGAFDSLVPNRRYLETLLELESVKGSDRCVWKEEEPRTVTGQLWLGDPGFEAPETQQLPCSYDWPAEPREPSKQPGRFKKAKALPKRCSRACRRYEPIPPPDPAEIEPYTDEDIRRIELEVLGVFLSSTPFDRVPEEDRAACSTADEVLTADPGDYLMLGLIRKVRRTRDRHDREMAFATLATERGELEVVIFSGEFARYRAALVSGRLVFAAIKKTYRGQHLDLLEDLDA